METKQYFIGLMSGTSLDGIDIALVQIADESPIRLIDFACAPLPKPLVKQLTTLSISEQISLEMLGQTGIELAELCAEGCLSVLAKNALSPEQITAIGSHGVTVRHRPELTLPFTLQITDPNRLAALTNIDVIADFRGMDMAHGGQGAPLVPKFHQALLPPRQDGIFVNLGGIANITVIEQNKPVIGYDTGPANTLMNLWCQQHRNESYDDNGKWAASGKVNQDLLASMLADDFFSQPHPKSTGKEKFNFEWLNDHLALLTTGVKPEDVQATLLMLTAQTLADQLKQFSASVIYLCGGGAQNSQLKNTLGQLLPEKSFLNTDKLGINSDALEAMAFAWFAYCRVNNKTANVPSVTGASSSATLGAWYSANREEQL